MYIPRTSNKIKNLVIQRSDENTHEPTGTQADIPGTTITYTPDSDATKVVYEYSMQTRDDPDLVNYIMIELYHNVSGTWAPLGDGYRLDEVTVYSKSQMLMTAKFVMNAWSGSREFKVRACALNASNFGGSIDRSCKFHQDDHGQKNDPIVTMYSLV